MVRNPRSFLSQCYLKKYKDKKAMPIFCLDDANKIFEQVKKFANEQPLLGRIIYSRYIQDKSFEEIAVDVGYSIDHIKRLHSEALYCFFPYVIK